MNTQPEALRLAEQCDTEWPEDCDIHAIAAELRRLHALNAELLEALKLALSAHGRLLLTDPPQDPWKVWSVEAKARAAIAKATGDA